MLAQQRQPSADALLLVQDEARDGEKVTAFYSRFISPGNTVFDIGANHGNRTEIFSQLADTVVAVEPQLRLLDKFKLYPNVHIVEKAVGAAANSAEMMVSNFPSVGSLSPHWVAAVKQSGRFPQCNWDKRRTVEMTTLDALIEEYGKPAFIKIDVEGFESEVLRGLSQAVAALSIEFTPEFAEATYCSIKRLLALGNYEFNWDFRETFSMPWDGWMGEGEVLRDLSRFSGDNIAYGDVYARLKAA